MEERAEASGLVSSLFTELFVLEVLCIHSVGGSITSITELARLTVFYNLDDHPSHRASSSMAPSGR